VREDLDGWLASRLRPLGAAAAAPPPRYAQHRHPGRRLGVTAIPAALGMKLAAGAVILAAAAGIGVKAAVTGNANPLDWSPAPPAAQRCSVPAAPADGSCPAGRVDTGAPAQGARPVTAPEVSARPGATASPGPARGSSRAHPTPAPGGTGHGHPTPPPRPTSPGSGGGGR
jgi:hypothetical protein